MDRDWGAYVRGRRAVLQMSQYDLADRLAERTNRSRNVWVVAVRLVEDGVLLPSHEIAAKLGNVLGGA